MNDRSGRTPEPETVLPSPASGRTSGRATNQTGNQASNQPSTRTSNCAADQPESRAVTPCLPTTALAVNATAPGRPDPSRSPLAWPGTNRRGSSPDPHEREAFLTRLALDARAGDRAARDQLYEELAPNIRRMVAGCARLTWAADCPRREGRPWDREDVAQEAFLVFCDLIAAWSGQGPVTPYLFAYFPWRLRNAWRKLRPDRPRGVTILRAEPGLTADPSATAAEATVLLEALASELPVVESAILLLHVRDGLSLAEIGRRFGVRPRQVGRRWAGIKRWLRGELTVTGEDGRLRRIRPSDAPPPNAPG